MIRYIHENRQTKWVDADYASLAAFRYELRKFLNFSEDAARQAGIEPQQHQALLAMKRLPYGTEATVGRLAQRMQIRYHSAVELSDRLETRGFLTRSRSLTDRRQVLLRLTRRGESLVHRLSLAHGKQIRKAGPGLIAALEAAILLAEYRPGERKLPSGTRPRSRR